MVVFELVIIKSTATNKKCAFTALKWFWFITAPALFQLPGKPSVVNISIKFTSQRLFERRNMKKKKKDFNSQIFSR